MSRSNTRFAPSRGSRGRGRTTTETPTEQSETAKEGGDITTARSARFRPPSRRRQLPTFLFRNRGSRTTTESSATSETPSDTLEDSPQEAEVHDTTLETSETPPPEASTTVRSLQSLLSRSRGRPRNRSSLFNRRRGLEQTTSPTPSTVSESEVEEEIPIEGTLEGASSVALPDVEHVEEKVEDTGGLLSRLRQRKPGTLFRKR